MNLTFFSIVLITLINLILPATAYAYFNPNEFAFLKAIILYVFGAAAVITVLWRKIMGRMKNLLCLLRKQYKTKK